MMIAIMNVVLDNNSMRPRPTAAVCTCLLWQFAKSLACRSKIPHCVDCKSTAQMVLFSLMISFIQSDISRVRSFIFDTIG